MNDHKEKAYCVKQTSPKKGLPNGAWVCYEFNTNFIQAFGNSPVQSLENYLLIINKKNAERS